MPRHTAIIIGSKSRAQLVPVHKEADVDNWGNILGAHAMGRPRPPAIPETPPAGMKAARLIGVSCNEMIKRCRMNGYGVDMW